MRSVDSTTLAALGSKQLKARTFIWFTAKDNLNVTHSVGFWDDLGTVTASYVDFATGATLSRAYVGAGTLIGLDNIPLTSDVSIRNVNATLSQIDTTVADLVRGYNMRGAAVEIHRGLFNPGSFQLVAALSPRFIGFVDTMTITDPSEGKEGSITISLVSHTRNLTRTNSDVCSDASQKLRSATDTFYKDVGVVGAWQIFWAEKRGTITSPTLPDTGNASSD